MFDFAWDWFYGTLASLGIYHKDARMLFLGLDNAGKTTLLGVLKDDRAVSAEPTIHPNSEELIVGKLKFKTFDLGGHESARRLWEDYTANVDCVVYLVDAVDRSRFPEAKYELDKLLSSDELSGIPFLVLGNKIDLADAVSEEELKYELGLRETYGKEIGQRRDDLCVVELFMCSVVRRMGYKDGFQWLSQLLT